jgi:eukaryotic-like serine/threonine-protein kinase
MVTQPVGTPNCFRFGEDFELDQRAYELRSAGTPLKLKPIPMELLLLLVERHGQLVTRRQIVERIWGEGVVLDTDNSINGAISKIRQVLRDDSERPRFVQTVPSRGYRFIAPVETSAPEDESGANVEKQLEGPGRIPSQATLLTREIQELPETGGEEPWARSRQSWKRYGWKIAAGVVAIGASVWLGSVPNSRARQAQQLTDKDTIVIADFANNTEDAIFDETLKQALSVQVTQSPFLNVASDLKINEILRRMGRAPDTRLTGEVAREVCLRTGGKAVLAGAISRLGSHYVVSVEALGCASGDMLGAAQMEAPNKESVLKALDGAASQVRGKVGESVASLEKYDFPVDTTTKSLEALKAFSLGSKALRERGEGEAIPFFRQAVRIDPEFALAYATLGRAYEDVGEDQEAGEDFGKAYNLRDRLSERERYYVTTVYHEIVTGDMAQAKDTGELWVRTYPRDGIAREKLGTIYGELGQNEKADQQFEEALRLDPDSTINIFNAVMIDTVLNRMEEAERMLRAGQARGADGAPIHQSAYSLAFLRNDRKEMEWQAGWGAGKANTEEQLLSQHSDTSAYYGRLREAREISRRAIEAGTRDHAKETAAQCEVIAALREVEAGEAASTASAVRQALALSPTRNVKELAALALARSGNTAEAQGLIHELEDTYPSNTLIQFFWLPTAKAALELKAGNAEGAVAELQKATPYELGQGSNLSNISNMYPVYVRGLAYLSAGNGKAAAGEFKRIVDNPGIVQNNILGSLARLQLGRAEAAMGDVVSARKHYGEFLAMWQEADANAPLLKAAQSEYARWK